MDIFSYLLGKQAGGGSSKTIDITLPNTFLLTYLSDPSKYGTNIQVTSEADIAFITELFNIVNANDKPILRINANGRYLYAILQEDASNPSVIETIIIRDISNLGTGEVLLNVLLKNYDNVFYVQPYVYSLS